MNKATKKIAKILYNSIGLIDYPTHELGDLGDTTNPKYFGSLAKRDEADTAPEPAE